MPLQSCSRSHVVSTHFRMQIIACSICHDLVVSLYSLPSENKFFDYFSPFLLTQLTAPNKCCISNISHSLSHWLANNSIFLDCGSTSYYIHLAFHFPRLQEHLLQVHSLGLSYSSTVEVQDCGNTSYTPT